MMSRTFAKRLAAAAVIIACTCLASYCDDTSSDAALGDATLDSTNAMSVPEAEEMVDVPLVLTPIEVVRLTVQFSPQIRRSYEQKLAEEARYDFFIANREPLSYGAEADFDYSRTHHDREESLSKTLSPQVFVRKEFYNTARASLVTGYDLDDYQDGNSGHAFVSGTLRVPLFASRVALQRANNKIYQQNKVNDARLHYYREIREQISRALQTFTWAQRNKETFEQYDRHRRDLERVLEAVDSVTDRDTTFDRVKAEATLASLDAGMEGQRESYRVALERVKMATGIPFETPVEIGANHFNPFAGEKQEDLEKVALETDEELDTLLNSIKSSQAELQLARKGKWDTSFFLGAEKDLDGSGDSRGSHGYSFSTGVGVTRIDSRISRSLEDIALARIRGYKNAMIARRRQIHADTTEAFSTLCSQIAEAESLENNLDSYRSDFEKGLEQYKAGLITVDELLQKRDSIEEERRDIVRCWQRAREGVARLLASTGRYEEFLETDGSPASALPDEQPAGASAALR